MTDPRRLKYEKRIIGSYKFNKIESRELTYNIKLTQGSYKFNKIESRQLTHNIQLTQGSYKFNNIECRQLTYDRLKEGNVPHDQHKKGNVQQHRLY